mmetsp:Transcript_10138/g.13973  ORF Transcript_10138/g.13973 Transcript_10138/m.13973 type:complete len:100 (+) Transcript_10138:65-364(+)
MLALLLLIILLENGWFSRASLPGISQSEQSLVAKASHIFQMFDKNQDQLFSKSELETLIAHTSDTADLPEENFYWEFCDSYIAVIPSTTTYRNHIISIW